MLTRILVRWLLPAILGILTGLLTLAFALQNEPEMSGPVLALLSPGLKLAEMLAPARREGLGPALSDFLRVGMAVNILYYVVISALIAWLLRRLFSGRGNRSRDNH